jgi:hypothetical protein
MNPEEKAAEEAKRKRCWDSSAALESFQAMIAFIDSPQLVPLNSKAGCLALQAKHWELRAAPGGSVD